MGAWAMCTVHNKACNVMAWGRRRWRENLQYKFHIFHGPTVCPCSGLASGSDECVGIKQPSKPNRRGRRRGWGKGSHAPREVYNPQVERQRRWGHITAPMARKNTFANTLDQPAGMIAMLLFSHAYLVHEREITLHCLDQTPSYLSLPSQAAFNRALVFLLLFSFLIFFLRLYL